MPTVRSPTTKPVTASLNVTVIGKVPETGSLELDVMDTVGTVPSLVIENCVAAVLPLAAPS